MAKARKVKASFRRGRGGKALGQAAAKLRRSAVKRGGTRS